MEALSQFEIGILQSINQALSCDFLDAVMRGISFLGNSGAVFIVLAAVLLCFRKTRKYGLALALALIIDALVVNVGLKPLVARTRPYEIAELPIIIPPVGDFSFPSGHTAAAFASAVALIPMGKHIFIPMLCFASLMGFSRIYLMVHFPTDVLAGASVGAACGALALFLWKKFVRCGSI